MPDDAAAEANPEQRKPSQSASAEKPLDTVSVPEQFRPIFSKAQQYVEQYFRERVEDPRHSSILISGERYILVRAASMSVEFFDLVTSLYQDKGTEEARKVASNLLFDVAHAIGKADARSFHERMGVTDPIERLSIGPVHFSFSGWAFVEIFPESHPSPDQNFFLIYDHPFSFESDAWKRHGRETEQPVCVMNAGYSSGWCEESFGIRLVAVEVECQAMGDAHCRFVMAPPERIEEHLERYWRSSQTEPKQARHAGAGVSGNTVPEFFQRKRMEEELRRSHRELEQRVAERTAEVVRAYDQLKREAEERQRAETLRTALYRIAEAADRTASLEELYQQVHGIIAKVILAKSFYIALYDEQQDTVLFPYYLDEVDPKLTDRKSGKGRTEYVLRTGKSLLCTAELQRELQERGEVESIGAPTAVWLGVPLRIEGKTIGVMAVQHYTDPAAYGESERQVLEYVSSQVARAIARKRAEEELQESEKRLRILAEASFEGLAFSENGIIVETNDQTAVMLGYTREEMVGKPISEFIALESRARVLRAVQTDDTETYEHMLVRKDGSVFPVETCARLLQAGGHKTRVTAIRDITERKRAQAAIREGETRLERLADNLPFGMVYQILKEPDKGPRFVYVSAGVERIHGLKAEAVLKDSSLMYQQLLPEDREVFAAEEARALRDRTPFSAEVRIRSASGDLRWISISSAPRQLPDGSVLWDGIETDITERKRVEQAHKQSEERFAKAFGSNPEGISISTQKEGRLLEVNDAYVRMMGYERSELIGKTVMELKMWAPGERDQVLAKLRETGAIRDYNTTFRAKGDRIKEAQICVDQIQVQEVPCLLVTIRDVTESRLMELQFRAAQKMEAVGRLAGGVAHDFNNVLMIISSAAHLMKSGKHDDDDKKARYLSQIQSATEKATSLTRQLLAFSRQQVLHPTILDLNAVVSDLWKMLPQLLGEDVETVLHLASDLGSVSADRGQIEQVIMNLAVNARDAMPAGGTLTVETANAVLDGATPGRHGTENPTGDFVMLAVTDTGIGMDAQTQTKIFEPFFTTKEVGKGTGLGLATVYGIVKQSAGHVTVHSEPGKGTTFKVYLPRVREKSAPGLTFPSKPALGGTETLLLVEDESALRELASEFLRSKGYTVLEAGNRREALHICRNHQGTIHALVTDVVLPGGGGPDLAKVVLEMRPNLRVLYMSGYTDQVLSDELLGDNATFLQKPFGLETLAQTLRSLLGEKLARGE
jgi:two-component system, cell cycle sensor histidine kinase and response regulator CckA